jgi:hypothetical protein
MFKISKRTFVEKIFKMQHLEVSSRVRHLYIYIYMTLGGMLNVAKRSAPFARCRQDPDNLHLYSHIQVHVH